MISLQEVSKTFDGDVTAVDQLSFSVAEGEVFGLIGTSGCGKTTTLRLLNRLEEPTAGTITINEHNVATRPPHKLRRTIGYVIQHGGLFPHYTVRQNIATVPRLLGWSDERIAARTNELLEMVHLSPESMGERYPADLSGGQQQRVGLARALAADPPVILMDEPFGALDPITKETIQQQFKTLLSELQKTVVLVTHDVFEAFNLCDRIGLMDQGQLQQVGRPRELLFTPANDFVQAFFANHRFQLEMMSITLADICKTIKKSAPKGGTINKPEDTHVLHESDSFFTAFEKIHPSKTFTIHNKQHELIARTTANELMNGFQQLRQSLKKEGDG